MGHGWTRMATDKKAIPGALRVAEEVRDALADRRAVVALETTIVTHGMPYPANLETACFRVAQEALTNVVRHAQAKTVLVELERENDFLHLLVRDDGAGFDPNRVRKSKRSGGTLGLVGMEERASLIGGWIEFKSAPRRGTEVHAWFPLTASLPHVRRNGEMTLK